MSLQHILEKLDGSKIATQTTSCPHLSFSIHGNKIIGGNNWPEIVCPPLNDHSNETAVNKRRKTYASTLEAHAAKAPPRLNV